MKLGIFGKGMDRMPRMAFRMMQGIFAVRDRFVSVGSLLDRLDMFHMVSLPEVLLRELNRI